MSNPPVDPGYVPSIPLPEERVIGGRYRIDAPLAEGGMALVYRGTHIHLDEPIAIKLLKDEYLHNTEAVARFLQEARSGAMLRGRHVAQVLDIGQTRAQIPYIVTELLKGRDLRDLIESTGALPEERAVKIVIGACIALQEVHAQGIVHRDLKPGNIFLVQPGHGSESVKLLDFGVAKRLDAKQRLTDTDRSLGSPDYMSPEQFTMPNRVDTRADIWAMGVVLMELLTGQVPFDGPTVTAVCAAIVRDEPKLPSAINPQLFPALDEIVKRCLQKDRSQRFQTVAELTGALETCLNRMQAGAHSQATARDVGEREDSLPTGVKSTPLSIPVPHPERQTSAYDMALERPLPRSRFGRHWGALPVAVAAIAAASVFVITHEAQVRSWFGVAYAMLEPNGRPEPAAQSAALGSDGTDTYRSEPPPAPSANSKPPPPAPSEASSTEEPPEPTIELAVEEAQKLRPRANPHYRRIPSRPSSSALKEPDYISKRRPPAAPKPREDEMDPDTEVLKRYAF